MDNKMVKEFLNRLSTKIEKEIQSNNRVNGYETDIDIVNDFLNEVQDEIDDFARFKIKD